MWIVCLIDDSYKSQALVSAKQNISEYHLMLLWSVFSPLHFIFPRKLALTFHADYLLKRKYAYLQEVICMKFQNLFPGKNKKIISKCRLLKFLPSMQFIKG